MGNLLRCSGQALCPSPSGPRPPLGPPPPSKAPLQDPLQGYLLSRGPFHSSLQVEASATLEPPSTLQVPPPLSLFLFPPKTLSYMCPLPWALSDLWTWLSAIQEPPLPFSSLLLPGAPTTLQYPPHPTLAPESLPRAPSAHRGPAGTEGSGDRARLPREEFLQM